MRASGDWKGSQHCSRRSFKLELKLSPPKPGAFLAAGLSTPSFHLHSLRSLPNPRLTAHATYAATAFSHVPLDPRSIISIELISSSSRCCITLSVTLRPHTQLCHLGRYARVAPSISRHISLILTSITVINASRTRPQDDSQDDRHQGGAWSCQGHQWRSTAAKSVAKRDSCLSTDSQSRRPVPLLRIGEYARLSFRCPLVSFPSSVCSVPSADNAFSNCGHACHACGNRRARD